MRDMKRLRSTGLLVLLSGLCTTVVLAQTVANVFKDCPECPEMVEIPGGSFLMGSKPDPVGKFKPGQEEQPQHNVTVSPFALGKYEVTEQQWFALMVSNRSTYKGDLLPVQQVSWDDTQVFIQKLNAKTGKSYRLPTESEWEYAARSGSTTLYSSGDDVATLRQYAWFDEVRSSGPRPVGQKLPNLFSLFDMNGNVWEWVEDCYKKDYAETPADGHAAAEKIGCLRVNRGGSWWAGPEFARSAVRGWDSSVSRADHVGFRLAMTLP
jgi:formylglycine-generating enzyme required for sulfatase activity